jgi:acyl-coenzyme A synthetase/AMP-(fatty) acid ligase
MSPSAYFLHLSFKKMLISCTCLLKSIVFVIKYFAGDGVKRDADGYYWITGRVDDVLNISGHRLGTAEIESALVLYKDVSEAAVVGYPHDIKGQFKTSSTLPVIQ